MNASYHQYVKVLAQEKRENASPMAYLTIIEVPLIPFSSFESLY